MPPLVNTPTRQPAPSASVPVVQGWATLMITADGRRMRARVLDGTFAIFQRYSERHKKQVWAAWLLSQDWFVACQWAEADAVKVCEALRPFKESLSMFPRDREALIGYLRQRHPWLEQWLTGSLSDTGTFTPLPDGAR